MSLIFTTVSNICCFDLAQQVRVSPCPGLSSRKKIALGENVSKSSVPSPRIPQQKWLISSGRAKAKLWTVWEQRSLSWINQTRRQTDDRQPSHAKQRSQGSGGKRSKALCVHPVRRFCFERRKSRRRRSLVENDFPYTLGSVLLWTTQAE